MRQNQDQNRRRVVWAATIAAPLLFLFLYVDDWSRDFTSSEALIASDAKNPELYPLRSQRSSAELVEGARAAAGRIRNWEYVGEAADGNVVRILFVRTNRLTRLKDDIVIRIEDLGQRRLVTGESRSRFRAIGDLGGNPRNLRRFLSELRDVLDGAVPAGSSPVTGRP